MFKGISFALGACFIWGLIFVVPQFMVGFSSIEVALGRYLFYGIISSLIFFKAKLQHRCQYPKSIWIKALYFSLITIGYYTFVVLALRYSTPAICALILGISPITIAFYGNWKQRETTFKSLILPSILILIGLIIINAPHLIKNTSLTSYILGLIYALLALGSWSWYVVANSRFLKKYPEVSSSDWSTLIGFTTLFWVILLGLFLSLFIEGQLELHKYVSLNTELFNFLIGSAILGLLCSWVGAFLWNRASLYLPVSLAGQLTVFETIFGVIFVFSIDKHIPTAFEWVGMLFLLGGVIYGIRQFTQKKSYNKNLTPH